MSDVRAIDERSLREARKVVEGGGLVVLPTDTVYGIACDPRNADAIARIYAAKRRPRTKALQVIMASVDDLGALGLTLPTPLNRLAAQLLPGAFSPIALADDDCALCTTSRDARGVRTQAIRVPNSHACLEVLRATGPLAASSANRSGDESAQSVDEAVHAFGDAVDLYLDGGPTIGHVASTVVAADPLALDGVEILREGVIPASAIRRTIHMNGGGLGL